MHVVVTRPLPDGERTAEVLRARGHSVLVAPLMRIEPVTAHVAGGWGGVIITSANAVTAIAGNPAREQLFELPLYAVGKRSADAAREAGFADVVTVSGDVRDLVRLVGARRPAAPLLYLAGENRAGDLVAELNASGIAVEMAVVYRAITAPFPPDLTVAIKAGEVGAVLHFSRRSAENYIAGARQAGVSEQALDPRQVCLSAQVAEAFKGTPHVAVAKRPHEAALIEALERSQA